MSTQPDTLLLLDHLLGEQQALRTPVAVFSDRFDSGAHAARFSHLIPLSRPSPGEQYAFEVDLDSCTGCKACVGACHSLNGLDEHESWRDIGMLVGTRRQPYLQTVTTACHHCVEPACALGCPVLAYDKDPGTGIVRHLDDQCIGCSYCILKCPYDVPKFNLKRGIVRKCDMCQGRLAEGEAPACVQACPNEAIRITSVKVAAVPSEGALLPGAHDSGYTKPATRYVSQRAIPAQARAADATQLALDTPHNPLASMLVLTQLGAGGLLVCATALWCGAIDQRTALITSGVALAAGLLGVAMSVLHLGQPLKAWRAFLGWRHSWLSREILAFCALPAGTAAIMAAGFWGSPLAVRWSIAATAIGALAAVGCSIMVYVDTRRPFWRLPQTTGKFGGTTLLLGACTCALTWHWLGLKTGWAALGLTEIFRWVFAVWEMKAYQRALLDENHPWHKSAAIMRMRLRRRMALRDYLLVITGLLIPAALIGKAPVVPLAALSLGLTIASQWVERQYFFTAAAGPKMPGN
jgi:Fe-S-cluster-containing dehydrogenase component/DMSO reductase anchor subunit